MTGAIPLEELTETTRHGGPSLQLLDSFELVCEGRHLELPLPAQRLLAFLALHDQPTLRGYVAGTLWLDSSEAHAAGSLRSALWRIRRLGPRLVEARGSRLELASVVAVDVRGERGLGAARARSVVRAPRRRRGADLAAGTTLADWYEDWIEIERERLRALRAHALEALCHRLTGAGRFGEATEAGLAAVRDEPLRESAHRVLIGVHIAEGNRAAALYQYRAFALLLHEEVAMAPSSRMELLMESMTGRP